MNGLSDIVNGILKSADEEISAIKAEAKAETEKIMLQAKETSDAESSELLKNTEIEAARILKNTADTINAEKRLLLLSAKQEIVGNMLSAAKEKLMNLSGEAYETLLLGLLKKNMKSGRCVAHFSSGDNISESFLDSFKKIAGDAGCLLEIGQSSDSFKKGFTLAYPYPDGEKIENCSFDRLFDSGFLELCDKAADILFK